jgi:hypothetical protein
VGADRSTNMHVAAAFTPTPNLQIKMEEKDKKPVEAAAPTNPAPAPAPKTEKPAAADIEAAAAAAVKAERERVSAITAACGDDFPEIRAKAVSEGWDVAKTNAELLTALRARTPVATPTVTVKADAPTEQVLAAALAISAGVDADTLAAGGKEAEKAVEAAAKYSGIGLKDTLRECVRASGKTVGVTMDDALIRAAFNQRRKTLANAVSHGYSLEGRQFTREEVTAALEKIGLPPTVRGEALSLEQFAALSLIMGQNTDHNTEEKDDL